MTGVAIIFLAASVAFPIWAVADSLWRIAAELKRANDRVEGKK
jgi:hypothetical protein